MREHFYLITEHENDDKVGACKTSEGGTAHEKNTEREVHKFDKEEGDFYTAGKEVYMGYVDFDTDDPSNDQYADAIERKMGEIDGKWIDKAGLDPEEW